VTIQRYIKIVCDDCGRLGFEAADPGEGAVGFHGRSELRGKGWRTRVCLDERLRDDKDYCPSCAAEHGLAYYRCQYPTSRIPLCPIGGTEHFLFPAPSNRWCCRNCQADGQTCLFDRDDLDWVWPTPDPLPEGVAV
jgi:hypothetical protein